MATTRSLKSGVTICIQKVLKEVFLETALKSMYELLSLSPSLTWPIPAWLLCPLADTSGQPSWKVGHLNSPWHSPSQPQLPKWQLNINLCNYLFNLWISCKLWMLKEHGTGPEGSLQQTSVKEKMETVNGWKQVHSPTENPTYWSPLQVERAALESLTPRMLPW